MPWLKRLLQTPSYPQEGDSGRYRALVAACYLLTASLALTSIFLRNRHIEASFTILALERGRDLATLHDERVITQQINTTLGLTAGIQYQTFDTATAASSWLNASVPLLPERTEWLQLDTRSPPSYRYLSRRQVTNSDHAQPAGQENFLGIRYTAAASQALQRRQTHNMLWLHAMVWLAFSLLLHWLLARGQRHIHELQKLGRNQQSLIETRTRALTQANHELQQSRASYRSVIESTEDGIALVEQGRLAFANQRLARMSGYPPEKLKGLLWTELLAGDQQIPARNYLRSRLQDSFSPRCLRSYLQPAHAHQPPIIIDLQVQPITFDQEAENSWVLNIRDVSNRLRAENDRRLAMAVFDSTAEAIMVTDQSNHIVMVNPAFTRITGYSAEEAIGHTPSLLSSGRHDAEFYLAMWKELQESGHWSGEIWNRRKDGSPYIEWLTITALHDRTTASQPMDGCYVATFTDITQRKETENLLRFKAHHDTLTGLPNRSLFEDHLQLALSQARRYQRRFALLYIDLDHFKKVNDTLGHAAGDELLIQAAQRMALCVRSSDTLARLGGDEFVALLVEIDNLAEIEDIAARLVHSLAQPFELPQGPANISGSVGIALYPEHGADAETLKKNADLALYSIKQRSRNAYLLYTPELASATDDNT